MLIPQPHRDIAVAALANHDPVEVLAAVAGLQLMPENVNALFRLEAAAGLAATADPSDGGGALPDAAAIAWVNRPVFTGPVDPFNNVFTDEFLFHYGSFTVFPGLRQEAFYIVRMLARALHSRGDLPVQFFQPAQDMAAATLMIGDAVAREARLHRGVEPEPRPDTYAVAPAARLAGLKEAVSFTAEELARWLAPLTVDALARLVQTLPVSADVALPAMTPLHRPILRSGDSYVVAAPHYLLPAFVHALLGLARERDQLESVASRFRDLVYGSVLQSALYLGWDEVDMALPALTAFEAHESVFIFDRDKLAHVLVLTDDLGSFDDDPNSAWDAQALAPAVEERLNEVRDHLLGLPQQPDQVLQLVIFQGLDRPTLFALEDGAERSPRLVLTGAELETIALLDGGRRLLLWKYARARQMFLERTQAVGGDELDLFNLYRSNDDSFYLFDEALPDVGLVLPEGVGALRREVQRKRDVHGAPYVNGALVEVMLSQQQREIPIYMPMPVPPGERRALLVEGYELPVWIFSPAELPDARYGVRYAQIVEALAYWMWRFTPSIAALAESVEARCRQLWLEVELVPDDAWFGGPNAIAGAGADGVIACIATGPCRLTVRLRPGFLDLVNRDDNEGERELMRRVLRGLVAVEAHGRDDGELLDDAAVEAAVDLHAPRGLRKVIVLLDASADPTLDDRSLPPARFVQGHDEAEAMDALGEYLLEERGLPVGPIEAERRTEVLNAAVVFHLRQLEELVATLSPEGLVEWLVLANEALVTDFNRMRLEIPTKDACYGDVGNIHEQLAERLPKLSTAGVASRFLIEYVAARPPEGTRAMSQALYDQLLGIAAQLHNRGYFSDLIHFNLEDAPVSVLPSRRLGVGRETRFMEGRDAFLQQFSRGEVARSVDRFPRLWRRDEPGEAPDVSDYDAALEEELGVTFTDMEAIYGALAGAGYTRETEPKVALVADLLDELEQDLGWPRERVELAFDLLALRPRTHFAPPGDPFRPEDVYPWRFNRALSYVRRPLIVRPTAAGDEVVWGVRHLYSAHQYFGRLIIDGYLKAESTAMRALIGRLRDEDGRQFNKSVTELFEPQQGLIVRSQVKKIGHLRIERQRGEDLGDIDVLVADRAARRIRAVEAKDLAIARTPAELSNELDETFRSSDTKQAAIDRHVERVAWLRDHLREVLDWLGLGAEEPTAWTVEGLVVLDIEMMGPYLTDPPLRVITYRELRDELG
ncbi:MAG: hypothetical protein ACRDNB_00840 [Gaiellaceae bacterium]